MVLSSIAVFVSYDVYLETGGKHHGWSEVG